MTDRAILRLPDPLPASRTRGRPSRVPSVQVGRNSRNRQARRFAHEFERLETALAKQDGPLELREDPAGIAPERALVFVTAGPIREFARVAADIGIEVFSEFGMDDDYALPEDMDLADPEKAQPTLYATMPSERSLRSLVRLWRGFEAGERLERGQTPWTRLFQLLAEIRPWGAEDRLPQASRDEINARLPRDGNERVSVELEIWPTRSADLRQKARERAWDAVRALGGHVVDESSIDQQDFVYEAMLVELPRDAVYEMLDNPQAPNCLAMLEGLQFVLPQTIGQSLPDCSEPEHVETSGDAALDGGAPNRAILLDGTPVTNHPELGGGVSIEDVHDLVHMSQVEQRQHATSMASLILRGDLKADGEPLGNSGLLSVPVMIDADGEARSPHNRLFVDVLHTALTVALEGEEPLAPDAFVINFSVGVYHSHFDGRVSALARLLDWWTHRTGILFVVSAGNVGEPLRLVGVTLTKFEDASISERKRWVRKAQVSQRYRRRVMAPAESLNALTVGAVSQDLAESTHVAPQLHAIQEAEDIIVAFSSACGPGPLMAVKPDLINAGGLHGAHWSMGHDGLGLQPVPNTPYGGLHVASASGIHGNCTRTRGTSCAAALTTRSILQAAAALTEAGGPYDGQELPRRDLALLTRALAVNAARWPAAAENAFHEMKNEMQSHPAVASRRAAQEVHHHYGYGVLEADLMREAPRRGTTLVGLGEVRKDGAAIFEMPLPPSLSGLSCDRSMAVTLAWFSPVRQTRARYRLAALDAIALDTDRQEGGNEDKGWGLRMKGAQSAPDMIRRGTVWSRRLKHARKMVPSFEQGASLPIKVQCRDASGGALEEDELIRFAVVVTLELETEILQDIHEEVRDALRVPVRGSASVG